MTTNGLDLLRELGGWICGRIHPLEGPLDLPLCARCTGLWLAAFAGFLLPRTRGEGGRLRWAAVALAIGMAPLHVFLFPNAMDLARFTAGALTGAGIAALLGASLRAATAAAAVLALGAATRSFPIHFLYAFATPVAVVASVAIPAGRLAARVRPRAAAGG